jgi:hypothetical protein
MLYILNLYFVLNKVLGHHDLPDGVRSLCDISTVGAKSIFSTKSIFGETFKVDLKYLALSWETSIVYRFLSNIFKCKTKNPIFFILCVKNGFKNFAVFRAHFLAMAITPAKDNFFGKLFSYSKRAVNLLA